MTASVFAHRPSTGDHVRRGRPIRWTAWAVVAGVLALQLAVVALVVPERVEAHSVGQIDMSVNLSPTTQDLLISRAGSGSPGFHVGDTLQAIIRFSPVPNGANIGPNGWVTFYVPPNTQVVGASFVEPDGNGGFMTITPDSPAAIDDGWGSQANGSFDDAVIPAGTLDPAGTVPFTAYPEGSLGQVYGDVGIFYSNDARTAKYVSTTRNDGTDPNATTATVNNGYLVEATGCGQLTGLVNATDCKTHNLWDANMTNTFGSSGVPAYNPSPGAIPTGYVNNIAGGRGNTPHLVGSPVAGPQTFYGQDYAGSTGPWNRIAYPGSYIGTNAKFDPGTPNVQGSSTDTTGWRMLDPVADAAVYGTNLSPSNPLPTNTNAVRWAVGRLEVGEVEFAMVELKITNGFGGECFILDSEVFGGDAAGVDGGKDNPWRYHLPVPAPGNSCIGFQKDGPNVADKNVNGGIIDYSISFVNGGNLPLTNVVFTDTLPNGVDYEPNTTTITVDGVPITPDEPTDSGGELTWPTLPSVAPGAVVVIDFQVDIGGAGGDFLENVARVDTDQTVALKTVHIAQLAGIPDIVQTKSVTPSTAMPGDRVTYTINVQNVGTATASTFVVTDTLPSQFAYVPGSTVTTLPGGGTSSADPLVTGQNLRYPATGSQTLATGQSMTIVFQADISPTAPNPLVYTNQFVSSWTEPLRPPQTKTFVGAPVLVSVSADLELTKTVSDPVPMLGDEITYTITATNNGPAQSEGIVVTDQLPVGVTLVSVNASQGSYNAGTGRWTLGTLDAPGGTDVATLELVVSADSTGSLTNTAEVTTAPTFDPDSTPNDGVGDDVASVVITVGGGGSNTVSGTVFEDRNNNGVLDASDLPTSNVDVLIYSDVNNNGYVDGADILLSTETTDGSGFYTHSAMVSGRWLVIVDQADLPPGSTLTTTNRYFVEFGTSMGVTATNKNFGWRIPRDLDVTKASDAPDPVAPGTVVTYDITVTNNGTTPQTAVTVDDSVPAGSTYVGASASGVRPSGPTVTTTETWSSNNYSGGTGSWIGNWTEIADDGIPTTGKVNIQADGALSTASLRISDKDDGAIRTVDLTNITIGEVTIRYRRNEIKDQLLFVRLQDGANPPVTLVTIASATPGTDVDRHGVPRSHRADSRHPSSARRPCSGCSPTTRASTTTNTS